MLFFFLFSDPDILTVFPTRLQFFEYESISFSCDGLNHQAKWRGVRNIEDFIPTCTNYTVTPTVNCTIYNAFETDTGKYWCEDEEGWKSNALSITVTSKFTASKEFNLKRPTIYSRMVMEE